MLDLLLTGSFSMISFSTDSRCQADGSSNRTFQGDQPASDLSIFLMLPFSSRKTSSGTSCVSMHPAKSGLNEFRPLHLVIQTCRYLFTRDSELFDVTYARQGSMDDEFSRSASGTTYLIWFQCRAFSETKSS